VRVLFNTYPWAFDTPGGGEQQLLKYAEHLPAHGIEVAFHDSWKPAFDRVDVVHFFSCIGGSVHFCQYVHGRGLPLVISSSLWITDETSRDYPVDEIRSQLGLADVVVTNSKSESEMLSRVLTLPLEKFMPVMNGMDTRFGASSKGSVFTSQFGIETPFVLNVGNIEPRKNQLRLIQATQEDGLPVVIIGHVRDAAYADAVFGEGGSRVSYLGAFAHDDPLLACAYAACSVFALPSTLETPGLAALEAAAAGAPLVVTSEGSTRDYFGEFAHYVRHSDVWDIRNGVRAAMANGSDSRLKEHVLANFAWPVTTASLKHVYSTASARRDDRRAATRRRN